jgi:predicted GIY-YIG superfamily endonuclease
MNKEKDKEIPYMSLTIHDPKKEKDALVKESTPQTAGQFVVYLLKCRNSNRTYIGSTNHLVRRLRQHNGIIKGGARATSGEDWQIVFYFTGFRDHVEALQAEWRFKHPIGNRRVSKEYMGVSGRLKGLKHIMETSDAWTSKALPFQDIYHYWCIPELSLEFENASISRFKKLHVSGD